MWFCLCIADRASISHQSDLAQSTWRNTDSHGSQKLLISSWYFQWGSALRKCKNSIITETVWTRQIWERRQEDIGLSRWPWLDSVDHHLSVLWSLALLFISCLLIGQQQSVGPTCSTADSSWSTSQWSHWQWSTSCHRAVVCHLFCVWRPLL